MKASKYVIIPGMLFLSSHSHTQDISYNYVELNGGNSEATIESEFGDIDIDGDSFGISGSFEISDLVYLTADYNSADFDFDIEQTVTGIGLGVHSNADSRSDVFGQFLLINVEIEQPLLGSDDDNGFGFVFGVRHFLNEKIELNGNITYIDVFEDSETTTSIGARGYLSEKMSLGLEYSTADDINGYTASLRFNF